MVNTEARYVVDGDYKTCLEKYRLTETEAALVDRHTIGCKDRSPFRKTEAASRYNIYVSRNIEQILRGKKDFPLVVGLFSSDGESINIYENPALIAEMEKEGIKVGSDWSFEHMGPNAVSIWLREQCALASVGEENDHDVLQKYAVYFCSRMMSSAGDFTSLINLGGIVILVPKEHAHKNYEILGAAISNGIISTMHFNQMTHNQYFQSNKAVLFFDTMMMENQCTITCYNKNTEDLFRSTYKNLNFSNAELLINPLPENSDFWAAVYDHIEVKNFQMTIKSNGQPMDCIVSVYPFNQPQLNAAGAIVVIDTPKKLSRRISKQVSNSVVITFAQIVGTSTAMENVKRRGRLLAQTDMNLLIMGESGVGKDVFAQAIHRSTQPFVAVNCGAIPRDLIASELFGYAGGLLPGQKKMEICESLKWPTAGLCF